MSSVITLPDTLAVDSRLIVGEKFGVQIRKGASNCTIQRTTASSLSNGQIIFTPQMNDPKSTIIDPYCYVELGVSCSVGATGLGATLVKSYIADAFALRQYPLASICSSVQVQINNQTESSNPAQFIHQLSNFQPFTGKLGQASAQSITPIMPDQFTAYSQGVGSIKNPLGSYINAGDHYSSPRGEFNADWTDVTSTTGTYAFTLTVREPIFNGMLDYTQDPDRKGLAFVNNMNITLQFLSNINRMFSLDAVTCPGIQSVTVNLTSATLVQQYLTSPLLQRLPDLVYRNYNRIVCNQTTQASFSAGEQRTIQSNSYSLSQIPKKIFLWIADSTYDSASGYTKSDFNFSIENVTLLFNNRSALLSNFNSADLYNACMVEEGASDITYIQSRKFRGAVLSIDPAKLLGLLDNEAPGLLGTFQLQCQVQCTNISAAAVVPNLWLTWAMDTIMTTTKDSTSNLVQGILKPDDIINAARLPAAPSSFSSDNIYGGSFWDDVKSVASKGLQFIKDNKLASRGLAAIPNQYAQMIAPVAAQLGYGGKATTRKQMERQMKSLGY